MILAPGAGSDSGKFRNLVGWPTAGGVVAGAFRRQGAARRAQRRAERFFFVAHLQAKVFGCGIREMTQLDFHDFSAVAADAARRRDDENHLRRHEFTLMLLLVFGAFPDLNDEELRELHGADRSATIKGPGILARDGGFKLVAEGNYAGALPLLERAAASAPVRTAAERQRATTENTLGGALKNLGRFDEAAAVFERALAAFEGGRRGARRGARREPRRSSSRAVRADAPAAPRGRGALRGGAARQAVFEFAVLPATGARRADCTPTTSPTCATARATWRRRSGCTPTRSRGACGVLGAEHPETAASVNRLAVLLLELRRHREALPLLRRAATSRIA